MKLFHATHEIFDTFTLQHAGRKEGHANGALGVWLSPDPSWIGGFGRHILEVDCPFENTFILPLNLLRKWADQSCLLERDEAVAYYEDIRTQLSGMGYDSLAIEEGDGRISMYVALDADRLTILNPVPTLASMS